VAAGPLVPDYTSPAAIPADLIRSFRQGQDHRKVRARLRVMDGSRITLKRGMRLMCAHVLLSSHRARLHPETAHDRYATNEALNVMCVLDAMQIVTLSGEQAPDWEESPAHPSNARGARNDAPMTAAVRPQPLGRTRL